VFGRNDNVQFSPSEGAHWFTYNSKLYWYRRTVSYSTEGKYEKLTIYTFGRNIDVFGAFIRNALPNSENKIGIYDVDVNVYTSASWGVNPAGYIKERPEKSVILAPGTRRSLMGSIDFFINNRAWYDEKYMAYKLTLILEGPSGTGKTSIIRMIATKLKRDVYQLNINRHGAQLSKLLAAVPKGSIVTIEDFDDSPATHSRAESGQAAVQVADSKAFSIGDILNGLDGIVSLDDVIIVLTTNRIGIIDDAIVRPGRVDKVIHVGPLNNEEIHDYIELMYGELARNKFGTIEFLPRKGCELYSAYMSSINCPDKFVEEISSLQF
jgi:mitochondrial chaperone BCS1